MVETMIPQNQSWNTFSVGWDVFVSNEKIIVIKPETDYDFIHTTCLEKSLCEQRGLEMDPSERQQNVIQIVELNMLEGKMEWPNYNKTWGISVDVELKKISTKLFTTKQNVVTDDMIRASAKSDGAAMVATPELDKVELSNPTPMSVEEIEAMKKFIREGGNK